MVEGNSELHHTKSSTCHWGDPNQPFLDYQRNPRFGPRWPPVTDTASSTCKCQVNEPTWYFRNGYIEYHRISWTVECHWIWMIEWDSWVHVSSLITPITPLCQLLLPAIELPLRAAWDRAHSCCESWRFGPSRATSLVQCCTTKCSMMQQRLEWKHMLHPKVMQICNCRHSLAGVAFHSKAIHRYSDSTRTRSKTMENWKRPSNVVVLQHMKLGRADRWVPSSPRESNL